MFPTQLQWHEGTDLNQNSLKTMKYCSHYGPYGTVLLVYKVLPPTLLVSDFRLSLNQPYIKKKRAFFYRDTRYHISLPRNIVTICSVSLTNKFELFL